MRWGGMERGSRVGCGARVGACEGCEAEYVSLLGGQCSAAQAAAFRASTTARQASAQEPAAAAAPYPTHAQAPPPCPPPLTLLCCRRRRAKALAGCRLAAAAATLLQPASHKHKACGIGQGVLQALGEARVQRRHGRGQAGAAAAAHSVRCLHPWLWPCRLGRCSAHSVQRQQRSQCIRPPSHPPTQACERAPRPCCA